MILLGSGGIPKGDDTLLTRNLLFLEKLRARGMMFSDDLVHWTRPFPTFFAA